MNALLGPPGGAWQPVLTCGSHSPGRVSVFCLFFLRDLCFQTSFSSVKQPAQECIFLGVPLSRGVSPALPFLTWPEMTGNMEFGLLLNGQTILVGKSSGLTLAISHMSHWLEVEGMWCHFACVTLSEVHDAAFCLLSISLPLSHHHITFIAGPVAARLVDGPTAMQGRLEVQYGGQAPTQEMASAKGPLPKVNRRYGSAESRCWASIQC